MVPAEFMDCNTILLPEIGFLRPISTPGGTGAVRDGSALEFQLEELVSLGVLNVALDSCPMADYFCGRLPAALRDRVVIVNRDGECRRQFKALMAPIAEDFSLEHYDTSACIPSRATPTSAVHDIASPMWGLYPLLLGIRHKIQIDLDVFAFRDAVERLRTIARTTESRSTLALVSGILVTYERISVDGVSLRSRASRELALTFADFVNDETYRHLSQSAHELGWSRRLTHAMNAIGRHVRELLSRRTFRSTLDLTARSITVATKVPTPDSNFLRTFDSDGYLPPSVPVRHALKMAREHWLDANPDILLPPELEEMRRQVDGDLHPQD